MNNEILPRKMDRFVRRRIIGIALATFAFFSLLIAQFFKIQMIEGTKWSKVACHQHFFTVTEPFQRGAFFSNTSIKRGHPESSRPFVVDIQKFHLFIDPELIPAAFCDDIADRLSTFLDRSCLVVKDLREEFEKRSRSRKLAGWLERETRDAIVQWWQSYARSHKIARNALYFVSDYHRSYPFGKLLGQVLHTVRNHRDEVTKQAIPTGGLELQFHDDLKGNLGLRRLMRSPRNALATGEVIENPSHGADVFLTVNHHLQAIAEEELAKGVEKAKAKGGWAVMMDPYNGEVLALAQYPFFDPSRYQEYFNDPLLIEHTKVKAVTDAQEPGSLMKPITLAVILKANEELRRRGQPEIFHPLEKVPTARGDFPGRHKELTDTRPHQYLNMYLALQKSSNIYMARMIQRTIDALGEEWYHQVLEELFGFGKKTGIELPGESAGMLPTPGKVLPNGTLEWSVPTPFSLAIGYNLQVNTIQMLRAYAIFANGGYRVTPTLVRKIVRTGHQGGEKILLDHTSDERIESFPRVLDPYIVGEVVAAMKYVMKPGGYGRYASIGGYTEAGKTGTARKIVEGHYSTKKHVARFAGFIPVGRPAFVMLVAIDEPEVKFIPGIGYANHGSVCAGPVFREIARQALAYLGIAPDDPFGYPSGDPRYDSQKADWMQEVEAMNKIYREWNEP